MPIICNYVHCNYLYISVIVIICLSHIIVILCTYLVILSFDTSNPP